MLGAASRLYSVYGFTSVLNLHMGAIMTVLVYVS